MHPLDHLFHRKGICEYEFGEWTYIVGTRSFFLFLLHISSLSVQTLICTAITDSTLSPRLQVSELRWGLAQSGLFIYLYFFMNSNESITITCQNI